MIRLWILDFRFWIKGSKDRKIFFLAFGALLWALSLPAEAQRATKVYRIGYLSVRSEASERPRIAAFQQALQELGYVEGKNIVIELRREAAGQREMLRELAAELVRLSVNVIVVTVVV